MCIRDSLGRRLPAPLVSLHFVAGLELARRLNWLSPPAELDGRSFAITIEDLGVRSSFMVRGGVFRPLWNGQACELEDVYKRQPSAVAPPTSWPRCRRCSRRTCSWASPCS